MSAKDNGQRETAVYFFIKILLLLLFLTDAFSGKSYGQMHMHMQQTTQPMLPITAKSNEATKEQLADARAEGDSVNKCMNWVLRQPGNVSGQMRAGEYKIVYAFGAPEGWYAYSNHAVTWQGPAGDAHLWLFVLDGADGRVVPTLDIEASVTNANGAVTDDKKIPFAWTPLINGYGNNIKLSGEGNYTIKLGIAPPTFHRHDPYNGDRFTKHTAAIIPVSITQDLTKNKPLSELMEAEQGLAKLPGDAYTHTLKDMYKQATDGKDQVVGDYFVACAIEYAEGWWLYKGDQFRYASENDMSGKTNGHLEVAVCDAKTIRFLPDLDVTATVLDDRGNKVGTMNEPFMWHPWLYHYGENWRVPKTGHYKVHVHFEPPSYRRYGKTYGKQFTKPEDLDFDDMVIKTGQK